MVGQHYAKLPKEYLEYSRELTRDSRIKDAIKRAKTLPVSLGCVHLLSHKNLGFLVRAAACFGAEEVLVIGSLPNQRILRKLSCGLNKYMSIKAFSNPGEFLSYTRKNNIHVVSLEITDASIDIRNYKFPKNKRVCIITGNETVGVPGEIIHHSDCVMIPNPGIAPCMNTSQAANVALYEYVRQVL